MMFYMKMGWLHLESECLASHPLKSQRIYLSGSSGKSSLSFSQNSSSKCTFWFSTEPPTPLGRLRYLLSIRKTFYPLYFWKILLWYKKQSVRKSQLIITISAISPKRSNSIKKNKVKTALKWFVTPWILQCSWQKDQTLKHNSCHWKGHLLYN